MSHTGVYSVGCRNSARRKVSFRRGWATLRSVCRVKGKAAFYPYGAWLLRPLAAYYHQGPHRFIGHSQTRRPHEKKSDHRYRVKHRIERIGRRLARRHGGLRTESRSAAERSEGHVASR
ncbi:protein of unknown function [Paraburkholderia kururiensis]